MNTTQLTKEPSQSPPGPISSHQFRPIQHQPPSLSFISKASAVEAGKITATTELDQQPNCVSSLINMSCRGRAEAFARSLQSRLRTLGSQVSCENPQFHISHENFFFKDTQEELDTADTADTTEVDASGIESTAWVNNNNINVVNNNATAITDLQPRLASTAISTETADSYFDFDMETMETDSPGSPIDECEYTRLIETSGSTPQEQQAPESGIVCASPTSNLGGESRGSASSSEAHFFDPESSDTGTEFYDCPPELKPPRRYHHLSHNRVAIRSPSPIAASLSSSESSATPTSKMNGHIRLLESGEGESSDSLPPSQSTNSSLSTASKLNSNSNSNSTLQDAEGVFNVDDIATDDKAQDDVGEKYTMNQYEVSKTKFIKFNGNDEDEEDEEQQAADKANDLAEEQFDQEKVLEEITTIVNVPEANEGEAAAPVKESEEEEYEVERPRVRRCSSLKTGKTPPGTPGRKKIVRFADVLGLDLADVRTFLDEVPKIPKSAYEDLIVTLQEQVLQLGPPLEKVLVPLFQQPGCLPGFMERLRANQVCLESAAVTDPISLTITGCVRVRNLDFHKSVHIRYSLDSWRSYSDLTASYVENSCDGFSDKFSFMMFGNSLQIGQRIEMAIRFQAKGEQFWDSNYGTNYCFQCLPCSARPNANIEANDGPVSDEIGKILEPSSSDGIATHIDAIGSRQWSNSFLY